MSLKTLTSKFIKAAKVVAMPLVLVFHSVSSFGMDACPSEHPVFNKNMPVKMASVEGGGVEASVETDRRSVREIRKGQRVVDIGQGRVTHDDGSELPAHAYSCGGDVVELSVDIGEQTYQASSSPSDVMDGVKVPYDIKPSFESAEIDRESIEKALEKESDLLRVFDKQQPNAAGLSAEEQLALDDVYKKYTHEAPVDVILAVKQASELDERVPFYYLYEQVRSESLFGTKDEPEVGTAGGAWQITNPTWYSYTDSYGAECGVEVNGKTDAEILAYRDDPKVAGCMAVKGTLEHDYAMRRAGHEDAGVTGWHLLHVYGQGDGIEFLDQMKNNPNGFPAIYFPGKVRGNEHILYDQDTGEPLTFVQVFDNFKANFMRAKRLAEGITDEMVEEMEVKVQQAIEDFEVVQRDLVNGHDTLAFHDGRQAPYFHDAPII